MSYVRTTSGLLARFEWDSGGNPQYPFAASDWSATSGLTLGTNSNGVLTAALASNSAWYVARHNPIASRSKAFVYAQATKQTSGTSWHGPAGLVTDITSGSLDVVHGRYSIQRSPEAVDILDWVANTPTVIGTTATVTAKANATGYHSTLFFDGDSVAFVDVASSTSKAGTASVSAGQLGFVFNGFASHLQRWIAATDRYVLVNDVPTGGTAEIVSSAGVTVVAATAESSGTVTLDLHGTLAHTAFKIIIRNNSSAIVGTIIPEDGLVAGGDVYEQGTAEPSLVDPTTPEQRTADGAWSSGDAPHALHHNGKTYFAVGMQSGAVKVVQVDHATGDAVGNIVGFAPGAPNAHISPALRVNGSGFLQVFWTGHAEESTALRYATALVAESVAAWGTVQEITVGGTFTYPQVIDLSDRVVLHWRERVSGTDWSWRYAESTDDGVTFGASVKLVEADPARPYLKMAKHPTLDRIDYAVTSGHPNE